MSNYKEAHTIPTITHISSDLDIRVFGEHEQKVIDQLARCVRQEDGSVGVLAADGHFGYSAPVGANIAYREHVSPAAVGYDIGCGNLAVATSLHADGEFKKALPGLMDRIFAEVSFGMGRKSGQNLDHPVIDKIRNAEDPFQRSLVQKAAQQLGTVGAGNHYVDLFADAETNRVWIGVHFGSRGFGHNTATRYLNLAAQENGRADFKEGGGEMEAPPDLLNVNGPLGHMYLEAMKLAGEYAYAGREVVVEQVRNILGCDYFGEPIHNHHNFAWVEEHYGEKFIVTRKGATPAFPGQKGFVGASMGEPAVILEGVDSFTSAEALYSTVHGAGRAMSRTAAAGKSRKRWSCTNRDCDWRQLPNTHKPEDNTCPKCGKVGLTKRWVQEVEGKVDWEGTQGHLKRLGIELRGANAEEAPDAYKRLSDVLRYHDGTVRILHVLNPLGVAMAPGETRDDYKD